MYAVCVDGDDEKEEPLMFCKEARICGTSIEEQYYSSKRQAKEGGGLVQYRCVAIVILTNILQIMWI